MASLFQTLRVLSILGLCWLAMMAIHELGHVLSAWGTGGQVVRVVLHPADISRTDVSPNPRPLAVAWGGAIGGTLLPLGLWSAVRAGQLPYGRLMRFFAGFCLLANGLYLAAGALWPVGDAADLVRHGATAWQLLAFGLPTSALGLWLWHGLGPRFGLGPIDRAARRQTVISTILLAGIALLAAWLSPR